MGHVNRTRLGSGPLARVAVLMAGLAVVAASCSSTQPVEPTITTTSSTTTTTTVAPTTTAAPTTTSTTTTTLAVTEDPDALLAAVNEVIAAQGTFLVQGTIDLFEDFGDSAETFSTGIFRGGQDSKRDHWIDAEIIFTSESLKGTFEVESRDVDNVEYSQDPATGTWEIDDPDDDYSAIDVILDGELVLADTTATQMDGVYEITGTVPADPSIEIVILNVRASDLALERIVVQTNKPREEYEGLIGAGDAGVFETEVWTISDYGADVADVVAPTEGLATTSTVFADGLISIQVPNDWEKGSAADLRDLGLTDLDASAWISEEGVILMVFVEDLTDAGFGSLTLADYVDLTITFALSEESVVNERLDTTTVQALPATILTGSADVTELLPFARFFYLHDGLTALNVTFVGPREAFAENQDLISFLLNTVLVTDPAP